MITPQGAILTAQGARFSVWAPEHRQVEAQIYTSGGAVARTVPLLREEDGYFRGIDPAAREGELFKYRLDGTHVFPPVASRYQPQGVHGPGAVVEGRGFAWTDHAWQRPPFRELIIYELHIGAFTPEGTFRAAIGRLAHLRELGVTAIEIMPVADFPGERNWGYDGVQLFAPARCYGTPDDFRALIDAAHAHGLAVILDVVYNHFGPDGNYITAFSSHYFSPEDKTPWGNAINFGHAHSGPVREFFKSNVLYWMEEFHMDGFRLDATHAIIDASERHLLRELAEIVHARGGYIVAEDERNEAQLVSPRDEGGLGLDAVWADDFHHTVEVAIIGGRSVYRRDFSGDLQELARVLRQGWYYCGQIVERKEKPRGTPCDELPPERFVYCISNHDQVGNRALGERLNHLVDAATYRAASALLLLAPYTPLLFMGQEWAASSPFQYFTDHTAELGKLVEKGRREEFKDAFANPAAEVPSPQAPETFERSKLKWEEISSGEHGRVLGLYRELIRLRRAHAEFRPLTRGSHRFEAVSSDVLAMRIDGAETAWLILCDLRGGHRGALREEICALPEGREWRPVLSTNDPRFGGAGVPSFDPETPSLAFGQPELLVLRSDTSGA